MATVFGEPAYGMTRFLAGEKLAGAEERVRRSLAGEGFGILTVIDVEETLRNKLGVAFPPYRILGACNPSLAHRALVAEPGAGLLLPCNVVVAEGDGGTTVSIADPRAMLQMLQAHGMDELAAEARTRLERALAAV